MPATEQRVTLPPRYRVVRHIANGGMAAVWAAQDELLGRLVAVKVLSPAYAQDERAVRRFKREARAGARLSDCSNVCTVYDIGDHDGRVFMVMEHLAGGTVADRLRSGQPIPRPQALQWVRETAAALDCAHGHGVVHRDVKPANLLLDERGRLAVGDFGIATVASEASVTQTGQVLGTAAYISPEQARGEEATAASDRYALAVVAYELLTGRRPFDAEHPAAQARAHVEATAPAASAAGRGLPPAIDAVLARGMAKEPGERPSSAGDFADELERALADATEPLEAPTAVTRRFTKPAPAAIPPRRPAPARVAPAPAPAARRRARDPARRPIHPLVVVAAVALLLGAAVALAAGGGGGGGGGDDRTAGRSTAQPQTATQPRDTSSTEPPPEQTATPTAPAPSSNAKGKGNGNGNGKAKGKGKAGGDDPAALNDQGFSLLQGGQAAEAVPLLQRSVAAFEQQGRTSELTYAYALYNLGSALRQSGRPEEAIAVLEQRLQVSSNQRETVQRELDRARAEAGE